jgi:hypothetical protein
LLWPRLSSSLKNRLQKIIHFHHPGFDLSRATSFPTVEHLLSEMMVNDQLFDASRPIEGAFTHANLHEVRQEMLLEIAAWFHEIHQEVNSEAPDWLNQIVERVMSERAAVISFNWDLILDQKLFGDDIGAESYGLEADRGTQPILLKPHGSLNWYRGPTAKFLAEDKRTLIYPGQAVEQVHAFRPYRLPRSSRREYMPLIIPPVYGKTFEFAVFKKIWQRCVSVLSTTQKVIFLGYSLPDADLHAKFILNCGFHNQTEGPISEGGARHVATGRALVEIVNPDVGSARRIETAIGCPVIWKPMTVAKWANA